MVDLRRGSKYASALFVTYYNNLSMSLIYQQIFLDLFRLLDDLC